MSVQRISIDTPMAAASVSAIIRPVADQAGTLQSIAAFVEGIASGAHLGKVRLNVGSVQATGTITFASFVEDDTVTVNGVVLTGKDSPSGAAQFLTGVSDESSANALRTLINASTTAKLAGVVKATRRGTAACSSVAQNDALTINGVTFTVKNSPSDTDVRQVATGSTNTAMGKAFKTAIEKAALVYPELFGITVSESSGTLTINFDGNLTLADTGSTITVASKVIVITSLVGGQIGNLCTLAISAHGSVSAANLAGGTEGTEYVFGGHAGVGAL